MLRWYDAAPVPQTLSATGARSKPRPSVFDLQGADTTRRNAALGMRRPASRERLEDPLQLGYAVCPAGSLARRRWTSRPA
ncbi:MAG: hypothetical protein QOJ52_3101 [Acidimicrobiaceae bacterium]|jgi:hypothetical protein|nr:hypothetical protein [Acidimicrobiaceae bacterium]